MDHGQRRAHFVRHVGDEIAAHRFETLDVRHVAGKQQFLVVAERDQLDRQHMARHTGGRHQQPGSRIAAFQQGDELGLSDQIGERQADIAPEVDPELLLGNAIDGFDEVGALKDDDTIGHRLHGFALALQQVQQVLPVLCGDAIAPMHGRENVAPYAAAGRYRSALRRSAPSRTGWSIWER